MSLKNSKAPVKILATLNCLQSENSKWIPEVRLDPKLKFCKKNLYKNDSQKIWSGVKIGVQVEKVERKKVWALCTGTDKLDDYRDNSEAALENFDK